MLDWTLKRISPSWENDKESQQNARRDDLREWPRKLANILALIASSLSVEETKSRYLQKFFELKDTLYISFVTPFLDLYIRINVLNSENISKEATQVIDSCIDRVLKDSRFEPSGYRVGKIYGAEIQDLIPALLFTQGNTNGARRFVNDDWQDISLVMPIIDKFISKAGWITAVITHYLTLCERAIRHYPVERFADQVLSIISDYPSSLACWRGTTIPARIASLVQSFVDSENNQPLEASIARKLLCILDALVDMGDRRSATLQNSEIFRNVRIASK
jgi:hypothetical protein